MGVVGRRRRMEKRRRNRMFSSPITQAAASRSVMQRHGREREREGLADWQESCVERGRERNRARPHAPGKKRKT